MPVVVSNMTNQNAREFEDSLLSRPSNVLHETVKTNFNKTASGKIYEKELKDIFCIMIICLDLKDEGSRFQFNILSKYHAYSFLPKEAISTMASLNIKIELSATTTSISYSIKPDLAMALLRRFFDAKLLHCPVDRTRSEPSAGVALQPTAKGVYLVQDFCEKIGMNKQKRPLILDTSFNSMDLFKFDRNSLTDQIMYSDYFLCLLFVKLLGPRPNVWSPNDKPDPIVLRSQSGGSDQDFGFSSNRIAYSDMTKEGFKAVTNARLQVVSEEPASSDKKHSQKEKEHVSPYHHRFFTNPESDSHMQYYSSEKGVRLFKDQVFFFDNGENIIEKYSFTGKAICQWLCDCTDIISIRHAIEISQLLLKAGFITPIMASPSTSHNLYFGADRTCFYAIGPIGEKVCPWFPKRPTLKKPAPIHSHISKKDQIIANSNSVDDIIDVLASSSVPLSKFDLYSTTNGVGVQLDNDSLSLSVENPQLDLKDIIRDPGMRYLFRLHLEKEFCSENLDAYLQLKHFAKLIKNISKLLKFKNLHCLDDPIESKKIDSKIMKLSSVTFSLAYNIYFTYLGADSPFVLNIISHLRDEAAALMLSKSSNKVPDYTKTPTVPIQFDDQTSQRSLMESNSFPSPKVNTDSKSDTKLTAAPCKRNQLQPVSIPPSEHDQTVVSQDIFKVDTSSKSSTSNTLTDNLRTLLEISNVFDRINQHIFRLMETDSFPKFINSDIYKNSVQNIEIKKNQSLYYMYVNIYLASLHICI